MQAFSLRYDQYDLDTIHYLASRQVALEERLTNSFRYVELHPGNAATFSYEFASLVRDAGSVFSSVMDHVVRVWKMVQPSANSMFADYRSLLVTKIERVANMGIDLRSWHPRSLLLPFAGFTSATEGVPEWWTAYNGLKHQEHDSRDLGNMRNALEAVAAVTLLLYLLTSEVVASYLFVNVGIIYQPESIDLSARRFFGETG